VSSSAHANPGNREYRCSSGRITLAVQTEEQWHSLAVCLGRPELAYEGAWDAVRASPPGGELAGVLEELLAEEPASVWEKKLKAHRVPYR
jgi:crotonobetainyl-CoA:carnitine CoA-transferase CaiB-like acyl-CoA transferase